jgi:hypothetical protein
LQAYYGAGLGDWSVVWERRAQPGDTLLLHAGLYKPERLNYVDPMMAPFDGSMSLTLKGTSDKPITIKSAGDGEVIFDGDGNHRLFDVMASQYHIFDGLTIRNTDMAIYAGQKEVTGAVGLTVRNCRFETSELECGPNTPVQRTSTSRTPLSWARGSDAAYRMESGRPDESGRLRLTPAEKLLCGEGVWTPGM